MRHAHLFVQSSNRPVQHHHSFAFTSFKTFVMKHFMILLFEVVGVVVIRVDSALRDAVVWVLVVVMVMVMVVVMMVAVLLLLLITTIKTHAMLRPRTIFRVPCVHRCALLLAFLSLRLSALPRGGLEWCDLTLRPTVLQHTP